MLVGSLEEEVLLNRCVKGPREAGAVLVRKTHEGSRKAKADRLHRDLQVGRRILRVVVVVVRMGLTRVCGSALWIFRAILAETGKSLRLRSRVLALVGLV